MHMVCAHCFAEIFSLGETPWPGVGDMEVVRNVRLGKKMDPPARCPPAVYEIMSGCWETSPGDRPTAASMLQSLEQLGPDDLVTERRGSVLLLKYEASYHANPLYRGKARQGEADEDEEGSRL